MLVGNFILVATAVYISRHQGDFFSIADIVFWGTVPVLIAVRYVDIRYRAGDTAAGNPATMKHWVRYTWLLLAVSLVIWAIAHVMARFA
jgi:heme/copper-type cytochrome/quinol oxidase subunit 2